ncbi:MAG TPA: hypothetical protein VGJ56_14885 [Reyranella sp.]
MLRIEVSVGVRNVDSMPRHIARARGEHLLGALAENFSRENQRVIRVPLPKKGI